MHRRHKWIPALIVAAALVAGAGCATTPSPNFYQLEEPARFQLSGLDRGLAIGVGPINVAAYLDRPHIVTWKTEHQLELSEFNRWAEPLKDSILRVIAVNLSNMLETTRVYGLPRKSNVIPLEFRVEIDIPRFDGRLGGEAFLLARWTLYGRDENALVTKASIIREPSGGEGYDKLIAAQNRALQTLSREIVDAVQSHR
jgi:uncharacterized lipoprotein YmbA